MAKKRTAEEKEPAFPPVLDPQPEPEATVAQTNVMRWHKTERPRMFTKGEPIPAGWHDGPKGMRTE